MRATQFDPSSKVKLGVWVESCTSTSFVFDFSTLYRPILDYIDKMHVTIDRQTDIAIGIGSFCSSIFDPQAICFPLMIKIPAEKERDNDNRSKTYAPGLI